MSRDAYDTLLTIDDADLKVCPCILPEYAAMRDAFEALPPEEKVHSRTFVALPDKHGNALRKIYESVLLGVIDITEAQYNTLRDIYYRHAQLIKRCFLDKKISEEERKRVFDQLKSDLILFRDIVKDLPVHDHLDKLDLGDLFADRGEDDLLNFFLFDLFEKNNLKYSILFSNHDEVMLRQYEMDFLSKIAAGEPIQLGGLLGDEKNPQDVSWVHLGYLMKLGIATSEEVSDYIERVYKPHLKLFSYQRIGDNHVDFFAHTPQDFISILHAAETLGVRYGDDTVEAICATIDSINAKFAQIVQNRTLRFLIVQDRDKSLRAIESEKIFEKTQQLNRQFNESLFSGAGMMHTKQPIYSAIWARPNCVVDNPALVKILDSKRHQLYLPNEKAYTYRFHFGHVGSQHTIINKKTRKPDPRYVNLETDLGKFLSFSKGSVKGYSTARLPSLLLKPPNAAHPVQEDEKTTKSGCCSCWATLFNYLRSSTKTTTKIAQSHEPIVVPVPDNAPIL